MHLAIICLARIGYLRALVPGLMRGLAYGLPISVCLWGGILWSTVRGF